MMQDGVPSVADTETEDEISDSEDSADEEDDLEDKTLVEASTDFVAEPWDEHATIELVTGCSCNIVSEHLHEVYPHRC